MGYSPWGREESDTTGHPTNNEECHPWGGGVLQIIKATGKPSSVGREMNVIQIKCSSKDLILQSPPPLLQTP